MKILVSACLLGVKCKYNGGDNCSERLRELFKGHEVIPVCPEVAGGLGIPRIPCEIVGGEVVNAGGESRDREFREGAEYGLQLARAEGIELAVLQPRSPSCGVHEVYDGSFSGRLREGSGVFAALLMENGFHVAEPQEAEAFLAAPIPPEDVL